ncbi:MAG: carbohydrate kinase, partial [Pseudomonadota bacterium]
DAYWNVDEAGLSDGERFAAVSNYLALVTAEMLAMIGADGPVIVEGPFAKNDCFLAMLQTAAQRPVETQTTSATGTAIGAALLVSSDGDGSSRARKPSRADATPVASKPALEAYAKAWRDAVAAS